MNLLRALSRIALVAGALASVAFVFVVGHRNSSIVLMTLFTIWVLSPFVTLTVLAKRFANRPAAASKILHATTLLLCTSAPLIYGRVALGPPRPQPAAMFLLVPLASWILIAITLPIALRLGRPRG